jgi:hypothetical protein
MRDIPLHSGVQLVGERGALGSRPLLFTNDKIDDGLRHSLFLVEASNVRVEGLHLRGPEAGDRDGPPKQPDRFAITVIEDPEKQLGRNVVIADNELDEWLAAGVQALGSVEFNEPPANYDGPRMRPSDVGLVRVERNYIHNNARDGGGYGVVVGNSAYLTIEGNVFNYNRHDVSGDGRAFQGYTARFNYLLQGGFRYGSNGYYGQHLDVHGVADEESRAHHHFDGGPAGEFYQVAFNTIRGEQNYGGFLGIGESTRAAFELRGRPAIAAEFTDNVVVHDDFGEAIRLKAGNDHSLDTDRPSTFNLRTSANRYNTDYTREIAAGDFDGDRRTDVFVATGTAWFFSRAGVRPWELLHESTKRTGDLALADIDNDGVTDVLYRDPSGALGYLKGGREALVPLTSVPVPINELRFGDFDGDDKTDIFFTRDEQWHVWYGRDRQWRETQSSGTPVSEMLFGKFDDVPGTDVVAVLKDGWSYSSGSTSPWARLNRKLSSSFRFAIAADFNGNGKSDIAIYTSITNWYVSFDGRGSYVTLRNGSPAAPLTKLLIGHFDAGIPRDQVVGFDGTGLNLSIWRGLGSPNSFKQLSTQPMR